MIPGVSVMLHPDRPIGETADLAAEAERLGYEGVWVSDSQSIFRDVFAALTLVAERTSRITIGTGVTNPLSRHPAVIAGAIGSIAEHAGGRPVVLGIGTGETAVEDLGLRRIVWQVDGLGLYPWPAGLIFERGLHVMACLGVVKHD